MAKLFSRFYPPTAVVRQLINGKSLSRSLFNLSIGQLPPLSGQILELGGKSGKSSYFNYLRILEDSRIIQSDLIESEGVIALNVEQVFPFADNSLDHILAFHLFEHVFDLNTAPKETFRVIKPGGRLYVSVPFLHEYHGDPYDYWRLTHKTLERLWVEAGFNCIHLEAIGEGLLTYTVTRIPSLILPPSIRSVSTALLYILFTGLDRIISMRPLIDGYKTPERFPLDLLAVFEKPING